MIDEDELWFTYDPDDIWVYDKLILSTKLGYRCGPVGVPVPYPDWYIVRPTMNIKGMGLSTTIQKIEDSSDHLPTGHFWCERFFGEHISVDYYYGRQTLTVKGYKPAHTFHRFDRWEMISKDVPFPEILIPLREKYPVINCEFIGGKLIEVHLRENPDFQWKNSVFLPVWEGERIRVPSEYGFEFVSHPDHNGRIGGFIK